MSLGFPVAPMKAVIGSLPADDDQWAFEIKWDGYRTLVHLSAGAVRVQSSSGRDVTAMYPELHDLAAAVNARRAVLDGELVVLDDRGRPNFQLFQQRATQAAFYVFDVLEIDGAETIGLPYEQRRGLLEHLVEPGSHWMVPAHRLGDGQALLDVMTAHGMEGVVAKRLGSTYQPGRRSPSWRKVKVRRTVELVIGGFTAGTGNRASTFGALLLGVPTDDGLRFAGAVGTGFNEATLAALSTRLAALRQLASPFLPVSAEQRRSMKGPTWVAPVLRATVEIAEWTNDGVIRHASFLGLIEE